jgi:hypothetical protein
MATTATIRTGEHSSIPNSVKNEPSKGKTIGFAIVIILSLGGLVVGGVGLGGYLQAGSLSSIGQVNSILMMAAFGGGGIVSMVIGIVGSVKNCQRNSRQQNEENEGTEDGTKTVSSTISITNIKDVVSTIDTQGGVIYGADAWKIWNVEVLDKVSEPPKVDLSKSDKILLYIPERIRVNGEEKDFNLKVLTEIKRKSFRYLCPSVEKQFEKTTAAGWVLIDKTVLRQSLLQDYETQKKMVEDKGCCMPSVLEAIVLNLMVFDFTGVRLYGGQYYFCIRCAEKVDGKYPVVVGGFCSDGLEVNTSWAFPVQSDGAACAKRKF